MLNDQTNDNILAARIKNSNREAFGLLYKRYRKIIYFFSLRFLRDPADAEEIVQIVFVSIWEHRYQIDEKKNIKSYIYRIAVNFIYNSLKKKAIRNKYIENELQKSESYLNPYDEIFYNDLDERIGAVISTLPPQQQKIFSFRHFEGLSHEEIAHRLDISVRTVENQIYRVNMVLKERFRSEILS